MSLVTRCPHCATAFRVTQAQLSARDGRVRCGRCEAVFNGVAHLLTEEAAAEFSDAPEAQPDAKAPVARADPPHPVGDEKVPPEETPPRESESIVAEEDVDADPAGDMQDTVEPEVLAAPDRPAKISVPAFLAPERPRAAHALAWALLGAVALAALGLQAALHFRTELAVLLPAARPYLETACGLLQCEVRLPRRADLMSIESSDLQADNQRPGVIVLNALLRNRAPFAQEFPDLELTLTDQGDRPVIRRVLVPADYLQEKRAVLHQGMAGGAEENVRIFLETSDIPATGYQLFLFYSCPPPAATGFWQLSYPSRCENSRSK